MSTLKCVNRYFKKHIFILILVTIIIAFVSFITLAPSWLLKIIVDEVIPEGNDNRIILFTCLFTFSYILIGLIDFVKEYVLIVISQGISKNIRIEMRQKLKHIRYDVFVQQDVGIVEAYFSNDVDSLDTLITSGVIGMCIDLFKMVGIIVSIFIFNTNFGLLSLGVLPIIFFFALFVRKKMYKAQARNRALEAKVNNSVFETIDNIITIKSFKIYESMHSQYHDVLDEHYHTNQKANFFDALFAPTMEFLKTVVIFVIVYFSVSSNSIFGVTTGTLVGCLNLVSSLFQPVVSLGMELQTIQTSVAGVRRINDFFDLAEDDKGVLQSVTDKGKGNVLEFKDVSFSYDGINEVIFHFNLVINGTDKITLLGKSGVGKSTLFKLAYGILKPTSGSVTINGVDAFSLDNKSRRHMFGILYQDYFFVHGTIRDQVTLHDKEIDDKHVFAALRNVGLYRINDLNQEFIKKDFSSGELALLNIARVLLYNQPVIFLDEMNADIDGNTARNIIKIIDKISKDKIVLSINHYGELIKNSKKIEINISNKRKKAMQTANKL